MSMTTNVINSTAAAAVAAEADQIAALYGLRTSWSLWQSTATAAAGIYEQRGEGTTAAKSKEKTQEATPHSRNTHENSNCSSIVNTFNVLF